MSMQTLTCLQIAWTFSAYTLVVLGLPWLVLHRRFAQRRAEERWMGYFLVGNIYLIDLVFLLQFLHISNRLTLLLGTLVPPLALYLKTGQDRLKRTLKRVRKWNVQMLRGERTLKTELRRVPHPFTAGTRQKADRWLHENGLELLCLLVLAGALFYEYGLDTLRFYGYKASDVLVHNEWINLMDQNKIFQSGVYPHGFHCIIYYLEQVFGIPTYVLLRVFSLVETVYIHLAVLLPLKALCKSRYLPYLGVTGYVLLPFLGYNTYWRYTATLPQEYGMMFIIPAGYFALLFFRDLSGQLAKAADRKKTRTELNREKQCIWFDLAMFTISASLTISIHFYDTAIAGLFCIGIALAYCRQMFQWQYFKRIMAAGLLSIALAVIPMGIGLLQGNPLQGSFNWAANVINGTVKDDDAETGEYSLSLQQIEAENGLLPAMTARLQLEETGTGTEAGYGSAVAAAMMASGGILLLLGGLSYRKERAENRYQVLWAVGWLDLFLLLMLEAPLLNLPGLIGANRASVFFNYIQVLVWPLIVDESLCLIGFGRYRQRVLDAVPLCAMLAAVVLQFPLQWVRPICASVTFESNQAMTCTTNILRENKRNDWTICSANEERRMIEGEGYHEEMISFLRSLSEVGQEDVSITIPTRYIYFYIEKTPLTDYGVVYDAEYIRPQVSEAGASEKLNTGNGLAPYQGESRWVTMSHMYCWAQAYQKLHPDDMEVYYEDDAFVCYRLTQNVDSVYDLAIDYGYNDP